MSWFRKRSRKHTKRIPLELHLKRTTFGSDSTGGVLLVNGEFFCHTLEDEQREVKVKHETSIPTGRYQIKFREVTTGMTEKYRKKYSWFTYHLHLQDVPGFNYIYIHVGNTDDDTSGCILVGKILKTGADGNSTLINSTPVFEKLYKLVSKHLRIGDEVHITIE